MIDNGTTGGVKLDSGTAGIEQVSAPIWWGDAEEGEEAMPESNWLRDAQERCRAATKGPWKHWQVTDSNGVWLWHKVARLAGVIQPTLEADAVFIAHSRTDLPRALRLLAQAAEALEIAEAAAIVIHRANDVPYCQRCGRPAEELHGKECIFAVLDRIRKGGDE